MKHQYTSKVPTETLRLPQKRSEFFCSLIFHLFLRLSPLDVVLFETSRPAM